MSIKLGEVYTKMMSKANSWMKSDPSKWSNVTIGEDGKMKTSLKENVYLRGFVLCGGRDAMECVVGFMIGSHTIKRGIL
jgi:hypothetical protein